MNVCLHVYVCGHHLNTRYWQRLVTSERLEPELQMVVTCHKVLGIEPWSLQDQSAVLTEPFPWLLNCLHFLLKVSVALINHVCKLVTYNTLAV